MSDHHRKSAKWYRDAILKTAKEVFSSVPFYVLFALMLALWYFLLGKGFVWRNISPVEMPTLPSRLFYSALVYVTLGAGLYWAGFYKLLAVVFGEILGSWRAYRAVKAIIWNGLIFLMCFYIVPKVVDFLNFVASVLYNGLVFALYLSAPFGVALVLAVSYALLKTDQKVKINSFLKKWVSVGVKEPK